MKWRRVILVVFVAIVLGAFGWMVFQTQPPPEPMCRGEPLSVWLSSSANPHYGRYEDNLVRTYMQQEVQEALKEIGTNAIPTLLHWLRANDSPLKQKMIDLARKQKVVKIHHTPPGALHQLAAIGFARLGASASNAVPALIEIYERNYSEDSQRLTYLSLKSVDPEAAAKAGVK